MNSKLIEISDESLDQVSGGARGDTTITIPFGKWAEAAWGLVQIPGQIVEAVVGAVKPLLPSVDVEG